MKLKRLDETKKLFPHWLDRNVDSNFSKHLKVVNNQQLDLYHKIKTVDWGRMLEKPIQIWKEQSKKYDYSMFFKVNMKYLKEINIYKNPKIDKKGLVTSYDELILHTEYANDDINFFNYVHEDTSNLIIPRDTYILEVYTWDDYHFLKGFPENDYTQYNELDYRFNESYLKIEYEEISYSKFLTFRVHMDKIKMVEIFKNENLLYQEDFILKEFNNTKLYSKDFSYKYFDYDSNGNIDTIYEIEDAGKNSTTIYRANTEKDEYVFRLPLFDDDFEKNFNYSQLIEEYPNTDEYIISSTAIDPSLETIGTVVLIKEDGVYNAYETIIENDEYSFNLLQSNVSYSLGLIKDNYDLYVTTFEKKGKCASEDVLDFSKIEQVVPNRDSYIIVNVLPNPSDLTIGKILIIKEDGVYNAYETIIENDEYSFNLLVEDIDFLVKKSPKGNKTYRKRYSGYDNILGDCFDHDYSLDKIGHLYNIHRYKFYNVPHKNEYYYSRTYPKYNNRLTEDDYHYMKRIQRYIDEYNETYFPVLEFWKYYYAPSTLVNRKVHLAEQDVTYLRTNFDSSCRDEDGNVLAIAEELIDEEFDTEDTVTEYGESQTNTTINSLDLDGNVIHYSISKATNNSGKSTHINIDDYDWEEAIVVNNVYVVSDTNYRFRYGVADNSDDVTIRMICYNRQGQRLRSTPIIPTPTGLSTTNYPTTDGYVYTDTIITIPSDTASIILLLESNNAFNYADVTFQKETVLGYDNKYMKTSTNWNSNVYDLYANYDDIPVNLRLDETTKFNLLFRRSLPLTKVGFFNVGFKEGVNNNLDLGTSYDYEIINYFGELNGEITINTEQPFSRIVENYLEANCTYEVSFYSKNTSDREIETETGIINDNKKIEPTPNYLIESSFRMLDDDYEEIETYTFEERTDSQTETKSVYVFTTPPNIKTGQLLITCEEEAKIWGIGLKKVGE